MLRFHAPYFLFSLMLFLTEALIAIYVHDRFIRPYAGDILVVILLYCMVRAFIRTPVRATAISVLLFAYLTEFGQYLHFLHYLGWEHSSVVRLLIGSSFSCIDLLCYTAGISAVLIIEQRFLYKNSPHLFQ